MADVVDRAQELEESHRSEAILRVREAGRFRSCFSESRVPNPESRLSCSTCGDHIDARRLRAQPDAVRCIDCQNDMERTRHGT